MLHVTLEPFRQLRQGFATMRDLVFLCLVHLGVRLAFVLKCRVPSCTTSALALLLLGLADQNL